MRFRILLSLLLLNVIGNLYAQQLDVKSFAFSPDINRKEDQRFDANRTKCAVVKVQVLDAIDHAEGNVVGDIVSKGTEKWVYLTEGTKLFRLYFVNHLPLEIKTNDYNIDQLDAGSVYILVLSDPNRVAAEETAAAPEVKMGKGINTANFVVTPNNKVKLVIDGTVYETDDNGKFSLTLPYGTYNYVASLDDFLDSKGSFTVAENMEDIEILMSRQNESRFVVDYCMKTASIYVDEAFRGYGSFNDILEPGSHKLLIKQDGYKPLERTFYIDEGESWTFNTLPMLETLADSSPSVSVKSPKDYKSVVFGLRFGANMASAIFDKDIDGEIKPITSFYGGFSLDFNCSKHFAIVTGLEYSQKGHKYLCEWQAYSDTYYMENYDYTVKISYVQLPLQLSVRIGNSFQVQLNAGGYVAKPISAKLTDSYSREYSMEDLDLGFDYGIKYGLALSFSRHFNLMVNHEIGMSDYKNNTISAGLGINF